MKSMKNRGVILWGPLVPNTRESAGTNGEFKTSAYFTREFKMSLGCSKTSNKKQQREKLSYELSLKSFLKSLHFD